MTLDDFVMLGTTVPEPNSDGRIFVCSAGVSAEYRSLVRLYPLARKNVPRRWGIYRVPVERNPKDSRPESFQVVVAKGVVSPRPAYAPIAAEIVLVNTPGVTTSDLSQFEYVRRRRPLYPFEPDASY